MLKIIENKSVQPTNLQSQALQRFIGHDFIKYMMAPVVGVMVNTKNTSYK